MTKHHKPKNVKLTSIARLRKTTSAMPMVGDPPYRTDRGKLCDMQARWNKVYAQAIADKRACADTLAMAA